MAVTSAAPTPIPTRHFWITDAAVNNFRERGKPPLELDSTEKVGNHLDTLVTAAIAIPAKVEDILDGEEEARLVRIVDDPDLFALVKKSNTPNKEYAVVTVMTAAFADKKRTNGQWSRPKFSMGGLSQASRQALLSIKPVTVVRPPEPSPLPTPIKQGMYLIMYKTKGDPTTHQVWADPTDVEAQLNGLNAVPGSVEVYKKMELGLRIINP